MSPSLRAALWLSPGFGPRRHAARVTPQSWAGAASRAADAGVGLPATWASRAAANHQAVYASYAAAPLSLAGWASRRGPG